MSNKDGAPPRLFFLSMPFPYEPEPGTGTAFSPFAANPLRCLLDPCTIDRGIADETLLECPRFMDGYWS